MQKVGKKLQIQYKTDNSNANHFLVIKYISQVKDVTIIPNRSCRTNQQYWLHNNNIDIAKPQ